MVRWQRLLLAILAWIIGGLTFIYGWRITNEVHKKRTVVISRGFADSIGGFFFALVSGFIVGEISKYSPWWLTKSTVLVLVGGCLSLGVFAFARFV